MNKGVSASWSYTIGGSSTQGSNAGTFIAFKKGAAANFAAGGTVQVDASKNGAKFVAAGSAYSTVTAALGKFTFASASSAVSADDIGSRLTAATLLATASVTFTGPSLAAGFSSVSGDISIASGSCTGNVIESYTSRSGNSVTFSSIPAADVPSMENGLVLCMSTNGSTTIPTGAITGTFTATAVTNYAIDTSLGASALTTVGTNGSSRNAYFINASNSTAKTSVLRLVNTAGYASSVLTATAYNEAGTVIGTAGATLGTLAANQMLTLTSADIESKLGITGLAATAKYRLVINTDLTSMEVLNYTKDVATGSIALSQGSQNY